jgi:hypothetical protein
LLIKPDQVAEKTYSESSQDAQTATEHTAHARCGEGQTLAAVDALDESEFGLGATVHHKARSGEIVEGRVAHLWEDKSVPMVRVASGDLVYNVPARMLLDERKLN